MGLIGENNITFVDWEEHEAVGQIECQAKNIVWNDGRELVLVGEKVFYHLLFDQFGDDGCQFTMKGEYGEDIFSSKWINGIFFFVTGTHKLKILIRD